MVALILQLFRGIGDVSQGAMIVCAGSLIHSRCYCLVSVESAASLISLTFSCIILFVLKGEMCLNVS